MFEKASRLKLRFGYRGQSSVEDLWDADLKDLDNLHKQLSAQARARVEGESLLGDKSDEDRTLQLRIDLVKHIVMARLTEQKDREQAALKADQRQEILSVIADKQKASLREKTVEELAAMLD